MTDTEKLKILTTALNEILARAKDHPCFDERLFDKRDFVRLATKGGDICDWTLIAIEADDALRAIQ